MTLVKVEGVSNEVFIPDQISDDDKSFLVERTENIISIATRAKVDIGFELLKVEQRFRASRAFGGRNGWYEQWYTSLGFTNNTKLIATNSALLVTRTGVDGSLLEALNSEVIAKLPPPSLSSSGTAGASAELAAFIANEPEVLGVGQGALPALRAAKASSVQQILAHEELIAEKDLKLKAAESARAELKKSKLPSNDPEQHKARNAVRDLSASLERAKGSLASLAAEKAALEAKYGGDNWRNEENIRKEFEAAIANARAEEQAKKAKPVVDTTEQDALKKQYEALLTQNQQLTTELASKEESIDRLLASTKKVEQKLEHAQGAAREWENYSTARRRGLIKANISHFWEASAMLGYCRKYPESHGDAMRDGFTATVEHLEDLAIDSMIAWLPFLPSEKLNALRDALTERGDIPPAETLDSRELTVINV